MVNNVTTKLDNIEEACRNDFGNISSEFTSIKTSIEALRNEMIQRYAIAQRLQVDFDQLSVANHFSSSESSSNRLSDSSLEENRSRFKRVFNSKEEWGILWIMRLKLLDVKFVNLLGKRLGRVLWKVFIMVKGIQNLTQMSIMRWVDNKEITSSLDNNLDRSTE
ncbi:876_t:CDS:1 [Ambispora gerdemannii]|uniref:876_t:CDS:1 n=1 Tax=Ambispora gerdemannii TaxID=144530 RepID=A0A9N9CGA0_9GLOM|nr:876_t:CDS:1 [Ambispora gerdemannii]